MVAIKPPAEALRIVSSIARCNRASFSVFARLPLKLTYGGKTMLKERIAQILLSSVLVAAMGGCAAQPEIPVQPGGAEITIGQSFQVPSESVGEVYQVNVILPWDYASGRKRYPVLYVLDGGQQQDLLPIAGLAKLSELNGATIPMIVVGIQSTQRSRDYTYPTDDEASLAEVRSSGGSAAFRYFLTDELIPLIEERYRTGSERAVIGESAAALFVVETFLRSPEVFDKYVAISPSLWWDQGRLANEASSLLGEAHKGRELYLAIGTEGGIMRGGVLTLAAALETSAPEELRWRFDDLVPEEHHTVYHPGALRALRFMFPGERALEGW